MGCFVINRIKSFFFFFFFFLCVGSFIYVTDKVAGHKNNNAPHSWSSTAGLRNRFLSLFRQNPTSKKNEEEETASSRARPHEVTSQISSKNNQPKTRSNPIARFLRSPV